MNRAIKFRARRATGEWAYFSLDDLIRHTPTVPSWVYEYPGLKKDQFTGRTDKNGKEIYEGDLIRREDVENYAKDGLSNLMKITFEGGSFCTRSGEFRTSLIEMEYPEYYEVVGNVYENPELLQEKPALT
jgi:uncharacterized phage protein (TIGR01671 family)